MTAALTTGKARLRCMISVGVGGASVGFMGCFGRLYFSYGREEMAFVFLEKQCYYLIMLLLKEEFRAVVFKR